MPPRLTDPAFRYTPAIKTDFRKSFARIRRAERERQAALQDQPAQAASNLIPITRSGK